MYSGLFIKNQTNFMGSMNASLDALINYLSGKIYNSK